MYFSFQTAKMLSSRPRLGFYIWFRHLRQNIAKLFNTTIKKNRYEILGLMLSGFALYYAITANNISKTALGLAQNDTTQTAQIIRLNSEIVENQKQNATLSAQLDTLISVSKNTRDLNTSSNKILNNSETQSKLINEQLLLGLKKEQATIKENKLINESDLFALEDIYDEVASERINKWLAVLILPDDKKILQRLKTSLIKAFSNKIFQQDTIVRRNWVRFYRIVERTIDNSDSNKFIINIKNNELVYESAEERTKEFEKNVKTINEYYIDFRNSMTASFRRLLVDFEQPKKGDSLRLRITITPNYTREQLLKKEADEESLLIRA